MLPVGTKGKTETIVTEDMTALKVGSGEAMVLATPVMAALMEKAAQDSVKTLIEEGKTTVGTALSIRHVSATPVGMRVWAETEVTAVSENGRMITFAVSAYDEKGLIGEGTHERAIVTLARFQEKTEEKKR